MKRSHLVLAAGLLALPVAAFAQTASTQTTSTPDSKPTVTSAVGNQGAMTTVQPKTTAPAKEGVKTDAVAKSASATNADPATQPAAQTGIPAQSHSQAKSHAGNKTMSAEHPHTATQTGSQLKQTEAPKS